jgi:hypothetical protein
MAPPPSEDPILRDQPLFSVKPTCKPRHCPQDVKKYTANGDGFSADGA